MGVLDEGGDRHGKVFVLGRLRLCNGFFVQNLLSQTFLQPADVAGAGPFYAGGSAPAWFLE